MLKIGRFQPRLLHTVLVLLLLPLFIRLGYWQLSRAEEKRGLQSLLIAREHMPAMRIEHAPIDGETMLYRPVYVQGSYDNAHNILLDNRVHDGQAGYHVLTPLRSNQGDFAILVDRGWVPRGEQRSDLPVIEAAEGFVTVHGMIARPDPQPPFTSGNLNREGSNWPARVQWVDTEALTREIGYPLQAVIIRLDVSAPHGYVRDWHQLDLQPEKSTGYAIQWFSFAGILLILYFGLNIRRGPQTPPEQ